MKKLFDIKNSPILRRLFKTRESLVLPLFLIILLILAMLLDLCMPKLFVK